MDKTREYLAILRKHHFWVICGVVLLASMTSWFLAESRLDKEFKENAALYETKFAAMNGIATTTDHPNDKVTEKMREQVVGIGDNVFDAWQLRYEEQRKVPQWQGELSDPFLDFVRRKEPDAIIPKAFCEEYMYFIRKEIDTLFTQVNARDLVVIEDPTIILNQPGPKTPSPIRQNRTTRPTTRTQIRPGGVDPNLGVTQEWKGIVFWDEAQREALRTQYYWSSRPTSQQVRYANEDLWLYRALLDIIKKTNGEVKEHLLASVKKIDGLYIGPMVQPPAQFYVPPISTVAAAGEGGDGSDGSVAATDMAADGGAGLMAPPAPGGMPGGGEGVDGAAAGAALSQEEYVNATLRHLRYVDAKGRPLGYNSPEPFAEFKIMPFEMRLVMDQRRLPELLANAANSPLPVEVRQVSIVSTEPMPSGLGGDPSGRSSMPSMPMQGSFGRGGRMPGGDDDGGGMGGMMMGRGARMPTRSSYGDGGMSPTDLGGSVELRPWDLNVEVRGVIYIFNKPNRANVGKAVAAPEPVAAPAEAGAGG